MTTTRTKSKKAAPDICSKISNKISTKKAFSVIEATRQNVLEVFSLLSNHKKLLLVTTEASSSFLAGFLPVKVPSKRHTWISPSVAFIPTKSPKVFNNRPQSLASAIVTPNSFMVPNEILDEISIVSSSMLSKMGQDQLLAVLPNMVSSGRLLPVLKAKQSFFVELPVLKNWTDQMKTELSSLLVSGPTSGGAWKTITSCQRFTEWMASTLVSGATFKIKLAHIKAVFQSIHDFLGAKSVSKDNVKLFCVKFASQVSLKAVFLVEFTSFVHLATLKITKSLVVSESGFPSAAVVLCDMPLGVSAVDIKTALSVFGSVTHVQYVVIYFEKLDSIMSALNHWSVLVGKNNVKILPLVNQNKIILSCNKFKAKLVNFSFGCTAFEISDMISQVGGWTYFISRSPKSGYYFWFALITFDSQANLDSAICQELNYLAVDYKISLPLSPKFPKVFILHFVGLKSYAKTSASLGSSEFPPLSSLVFFSVVVGNSLMLSYLFSLESDLTKLSALVESIVKLIGSLVTTFKQFINNDLVSSSALGLRINEILVHMGSFSRTVSKLRREVVSLKKECCMEDIDMSGDSELLPVVGDKVFSNLMFLWEHESVDIKTDFFKTTKWLIGLISYNATLFSVIQKMSSLDKFSFIALI
ncbi:hypothetical protein G9A89_012988 [Geosiphon pyriformis]|nr:hypothetical protein G9A89_012988 [Geosiphon pyriformis]